MDGDRQQPSVQSRARRRRRALWMLLCLLIAIASVPLWFQWNWLKAPIAQRIEAATGRAVVIEGDLDVDLGSVSHLSAGPVRFANAQWSDARDMAVAERVDVNVSVWPLLRGRVEIPRMTLLRPRVAFERTEQGDANWRLQRGPRRERRVFVDELLVEDGLVTLREGALKTELRLHVHSGVAKRDARAPLVLKGEGRYRGRPFELEGEIESPLELRERERPYRISAHATAGATEARIAGALQSPLQTSDFDLRFELYGEDLADLYDLLGVVLPQTPPYELTGRLGRAGDTWTYRDFEGRVGDSDVAGDVEVDVGGERPRMTGTLVSQRLDFDDLAGLIGAPPSIDGGETASPEQRAEANRMRKAGRLLPAKPYELERLRAMDADVEFRAADVHAEPLPINAFAARFRLDAGLLQVDPLELGVAGGTVKGAIALDARRDPMAVDTSLTLRRIDLGRLLPKSGEVSQGTGPIGGAIALKGEGNSVAAFMAHADGEVGLAMGGGKVSNLLIEMAGIDVAESLRFLLGRDRVITVRCAYADLNVEDGIMRSRSLAFDTTDTLLRADGTIDLREERFDLELRALPKDRSLLALRSPLQLEGTFRDPDVHPKGGPLLLRGAAAAALYAVAPPAALLALMETGPGSDIDCGKAEP